MGYALAAATAAVVAAGPTAAERLRWAAWRRALPGLVYHRERADGVDSALLDFLEHWEEHGAFPIVVAHYGGLRVDPVLQAQLAAAGSSEAYTLEETPHGRGGALDVAPYVRQRSDGTPDRLGKFAPYYGSRRAFVHIGKVAESRGLVWGGRWSTKSLPDGDGPHIQLRDWRSLPYPPSGPWRVA